MKIQNQFYSDDFENLLGHFWDRNIKGQLIQDRLHWWPLITKPFTMACMTRTTSSFILAKTFWIGLAIQWPHGMCKIYDISEINIAELIASRFFLAALYEKPTDDNDNRLWSVENEQALLP